MDGRGRIAEPVAEGALARFVAGAAPVLRSMRARLVQAAGGIRMRPVPRRWPGPLWLRRIPRHAGTVSALLLLSASLVYGTIRGGHVEAVLAELSDARDAIANAFGFRITSIALAGSYQITREDILTTAGVTGRTSLLFLDATAARARLKTNPWIAEATVLKLYPGRLHIAVVERNAFALWQKAGQVSVIAIDGTVLQSFVSPRFTKLPMIVGQGAETKAKEFLAIVDKYPAIRDQVRASVLVAERRWNLKLTNGIDVRLPESGIDAAFETLMQLDRDKKLLSRDIEMVDLRLPDRVTVRLSEAAHAARAEALKAPKPPKRKGNDA
jgi:cell division protein FtsQ